MNKMSELKQIPKLVRTSAKSFETMRKEEEERIKKMTPVKRTEYLKDREEMFGSFNKEPPSLLDSTSPVVVDSINEEEKS
jgi:hypothetical protein